MNYNTDIVIVGSGMVGGVLALGLAQQDFTISVIEKNKPHYFNRLQEPDTRISALSISSINLLKKLNIWEKVINMRAHPYSKLETWETAKACITLDAKMLNLPILGYLVENNILKLALWQILEKQPNINLIKSESLKEIKYENKKRIVTLNDGKILTTKLIVGADGSNSQVRKMAFIETNMFRYHQSCMIIIIKCNKPGSIIWQHFTPNGPRAFLPLFDHWAALVWYDKPDRIYKLKNISMLELQKEIRINFPKRLENIKPISVNEFTLIRCHALKYICDNLVLIGDAAHTIHPLAGQGVNLGYRDVATLLEVIINARKTGKIWNNKKVLQLYQNKRMINNFVIQYIMDLLYISFNNKFIPLLFFRNIIFYFLEKTFFLKRSILKYILNI